MKLIQKIRRYIDARKKKEGISDIALRKATVKMLKDLGYIK